MTRIRIATRRSMLALTQTNWVADQLRKFRPDVQVELVEIVTSGDRIQDRPLREVGGKNLFLKEIEEVLLDSGADIAVHSMKDVPTELPDGLIIGAIPPREDPRDALVHYPEPLDLQSLPKNSRIGTASLRRQALVLQSRPDCTVVTLRGNVNTRLRKVQESDEFDAIILASAGLRRLGMNDVPVALLDPDPFIPAPGQGALALEWAGDRDDLKWIADAMDDRVTRWAVAAERGFLSRVGGSCRVPVGAYATLEGATITVRGCIASVSGDVISRSTEAPVSTEAEAWKVGERLALRVLLAGGEGLIRELIASDAMTEMPPPVLPEPETGTVYLVGAGPGDYGLVTLRAQGLLSTADAVVYDYLANPDLLTTVPPGAERCYVGKRAGEHHRTQAQICDLLIDLASRHDVVVRLKGGDPFIFGRGGEEAQALAEANIPFEIVPGVTSAVAAPAYAGVPLTHRDLARSVVILTGHGADGPPPDVDWDAVARVDTVVLLMGARRAGENMQALIDAGRDPDEPALAVEWASFPRQRNVLATVGTIAAAMNEAKLEPPIVMVVGQVAKLHDALDWFARRPLFGKRVLVTRSRAQASRLSTLLFQAGAVPVEVPALEVCVVEGEARDLLDGRLSELSATDWVVFTSPNGIRYAFERLGALGLDARAFAGTQIAVIGTTTAETLGEYGLKADLIPERFHAEGLTEVLMPRVKPNARVVVFRAREARQHLIQALSEGGAEVWDTPTYFTRQPDDLPEQLEIALQRPLDLLTFASSKTVQNLVAASGAHLETLRSIPAACIGPVTRKAATAAGFNVVVQPADFIIKAMMAGISAWAHGIN